MSNCLPLMKARTERNCVAFAGGRLGNEFPLVARKVASDIVFTLFLNEHLSHEKAVNIILTLKKHVIQL